MNQMIKEIFNLTAESLEMNDSQMELFIKNRHQQIETQFNLPRGLKITLNSIRQILINPYRRIEALNNKRINNLLKEYKISEAQIKLLAQKVKNLIPIPSPAPTTITKAQQKEVLTINSPAQLIIEESIQSPQQDYQSDANEILEELELEEVEAEFRRAGCSSPANLANNNILTPARIEKYHQMDSEIELFIDDILAARNNESRLKLLRSKLYAGQKVAVKNFIKHSGFNVTYSLPTPNDEDDDGNEVTKTCTVKIASTFPNQLTDYLRQIKNMNGKTYQRFAIHFPKLVKHLKIE